MFSLVSIPPQQLIQPTRIETQHIHITKTSKIIKLKSPVNIQKYKNSDSIYEEDTLEAVEKIENDAYMTKFIDESGQEFIINIPNVDNVTQ